MAMPVYSWKNARIIIKDTDSECTIVDTNIEESDCIAGLIWLNVPINSFAMGEKVNALIISQEALEECYCVVRNISNGTYMQLAVYRRLNKENGREHKRYMVNIPGVVRNIWDGGKPAKKTENVFMITIVNMSASGILFQTPKHQFAVNDTFDLDANMDGRKLLLSGKIVRVQNTQESGLNEECAAVITSLRYT